MKEISQEKRGAKAALGLGLVKGPKGAGRSAFGYPPQSLNSKVQIKGEGARCLAEGWMLTPQANAFGFLHISGCFLN